MEKRIAGFVFILTTIGAMAFVAGIFYARGVKAEESSGKGREKKVRIVYPKNTELDFEGTQITGEMKNPGEFYFQRRPDEKFDSLVKRRPHFHREMLRDAVVSK